MTIKAIWAQARDHEGRPVIGREGDMPWHLPDDLAHFQSLTRGHAVIMGRRTWESLPARFRPLPGRTNIVVTSLDALDGAATAGSLAGALALADALVESGDLAEDATRWIIGGARVFASAVELADALDGAATAGSLAGALALADALVESGDLAEDATRWIIGGARMFASSVDLADELEITEIDLTVEGDTYAPEVLARVWQVAAQTPWSLSDAGLQYRFVTYVRRVLTA